MEADKNEFIVVIPLEHIENFNAYNKIVPFTINNEDLGVAHVFFDTHTRTHKASIKIRDEKMALNKFEHFKNMYTVNPQLFSIGSRGTGEQKDGLITDFKLQGVGIFSNIPTIQK